jgi:hypothetical protein
MLEKHIKNKIPCDRVIECNKCLKKFKQPSDLRRHLDRKTPCEPIQGDPCEATPNNFNVCKIKNGGMMILFEKVERLTKINEKLVEKIEHIEQKEISQNGNQNINGNNNIIKNHFNTNINIPLICFLGDEHREKMVQIVRDNLNILNRPPETDISYQEQLCNRIGEFVEAIYRNPNHKELQNVYTKHDFEKYTKDNAFTYEAKVEGGPLSWHIGDWDKVSKDILNKIYFIMSATPHVKKIEDVLSVMKTIMSASCSVSEKISDENLQELYCEIGRRMGFSTLIFEDSLI